MRKYWSEAAKRCVAEKQGYKCAICLDVLPSTWHADHIVPLMVKEDNSMSNCQILCPNCHALKTQKEMMDWHNHNRKISKYFNPNSKYYIDPTSSRMIRLGQNLK